MNMQHTVIPSWYQREGYINAMASLIEGELKKFKDPKDVGFLVPGLHLHFFFLVCDLICLYHIKYRRIHLMRTLFVLP